MEVCYLYILHKIQDLLQLRFDTGDVFSLPSNVATMTAFDCWGKVVGESRNCLNKPRKNDIA